MSNSVRDTCALSIVDVFFLLIVTPVYRGCCDYATQALRLKEIERRLIEDTRRKKHDWERDVEKMRDEFLTLHRSDEPYRGPTFSSTADIDDVTIEKRRGSADVLDSKQMKTMFLEYPDAGNFLSFCRIVKPHSHRARNNIVFIGFGSQ